MSWCWLALVPTPPDDPWASAAVEEAGSPVGVLAVWPAGRKPVADAVRAYAGIVDPDGAPAGVSFLLLPRDRSPLFDDPAVSGALRAVLSGPPPDAVSTLVRDSSHFAGAITVRRDDPMRLADDPFARLGPTRRLRVGPGLFATAAHPYGPVIQRYAGQPWPATGF